MKLVHAGLAAAVLVVVAVEEGRAELPPGSYDKLRVDAAEALVIRLTEVQQRDVGNEVVVTAKAEVLGVERSKAKLKPGDTIALKYSFVNRDRVKAFAGASPPPVPAKGAVVPAFLNPNEGGKDYGPAAHGSSFTMTPEATGR